MCTINKMPEYIEQLLNEYTDVYEERVNCMRSFEISVCGNMYRLVSVTDYGNIDGEPEIRSVFTAYSWKDFGARLRQLLDAVYNEY